MSCTLHDRKPDWNAFVLGEMSRAERLEAEAHAASCAGCQREAAQLRMTLDSMAALREEEIPRRIAFVSDKVFEPHWWQKIFLRPSFAGAVLVAAAILAHGLMRSPAVLSRPVMETVDTAALEARVTEKVQAQMQTQLKDSVQAAVAKAVAATREQDDRRTAALLATAERRYEESAEILNKQVTRIYAMNSGAGVR